jgi:hypothetical protein
VEQPGQPKLPEKLSKLLTGEISRTGFSFGSHSPRFLAAGFVPVFLGGRDCASNSVTRFKEHSVLSEFTKLSAADATPVPFFEPRSLTFLNIYRTSSTVLQRLKLLMEEIVLAQGMVG